MPSLRSSLARGPALRQTTSAPSVQAREVNGIPTGVAIRHEFVHQVSERVAGTEFNNHGYAGGAAGLHAAGPVHRPLDLARQLVRTRVHIEHCGTVDPAQQPDPRRHRRRKVRLGQRLPEPIARISQQRRVACDRNRQHLRSLRASDLGIMDDSIECFPCASDQHLVLTVDDRDISSVRLTDWIQRISLETVDGRKSRRLCRGFVHRRRALDREIQDGLIIHP
jgi:hypothetical protein